MQDNTPTVDQRSVIRYIQAALSLDGARLSADVIERVLELEMEYLQHLGIADQGIDDPRPE